MVIKMVKNIKLSIALKRLWKDPNSTYNSPEYRKKLSEGTKRQMERLEEDKEKFERFRKKCSESLKKVCSTEEMINKRRINALKQWKKQKADPKFMKRFREKLRNAHKGKKLSEEHKKKISENNAWRGKKRPEHSKLMKERYKKGLWKPPILDPRVKEKILKKIRNRTEEDIRRIVEKWRITMRRKYGKDLEKVFREWGKHAAFTLWSELERSGKKEEHIKKLLKVTYLAMEKRPTNPEKKLIRIIEKYNLPFKYTGDGKFWIGRMNPDFISTNKEKICIEVFGRYWHTEDDIEKRSKYFAKYGWKMIVFWEDELEEENVLRMIKSNMPIMKEVN